eukprot:SAG31_NODE_21109_length_557_cov_2.379913_1_plen_87_part_00
MRHGHAAAGTTTKYLVVLQYCTTAIVRLLNIVLRPLYKTAVLQYLVVLLIVHTAVVPRAASRGARLAARTGQDVVTYGLLYLYSKK